MKTGIKILLISLIIVSGLRPLYGQNADDPRTRQILVTYDISGSMIGDKQYKVKTEEIKRWNRIVEKLVFDALESVKGENLGNLIPADSYERMVPHLPLARKGDVVEYFEVGDACTSKKAFIFDGQDRTPLTSLFPADKNGFPGQNTYCEGAELAFFKAAHGEDNETYWIFISDDQTNVRPSGPEANTLIDLQNKYHKEWLFSADLFKIPIRPPATVRVSLCHIKLEKPVYNIAMNFDQPLKDGIVEALQDSSRNDLFVLPIKSAIKFSSNAPSNYAFENLSIRFKFFDEKNNAVGEYTVKNENLPYFLNKIDLSKAKGMTAENVMGKTLRAYISVKYIADGRYRHQDITPLNAMMKIKFKPVEPPQPCYKCIAAIVIGALLVLTIIGLILRKVLSQKGADGFSFTLIGGASKVFTFKLKTDEIIKLGQTAVTLKSNEKVIFADSPEYHLQYIGEDGFLFFENGKETKKFSVPYQLEFSNARGKDIVINIQKGSASNKGRMYNPGPAGTSGSGTKPLFNPNKKP